MATVTKGTRALVVEADPTRAGLYERNFVSQGAGEVLRRPDTMSGWALVDKDRMISQVCVGGAMMNRSDFIAYAEKVSADDKTK